MKPWEKYAETKAPEVNTNIAPITTNEEEDNQGSLGALAKGAFLRGVVPYGKNIDVYSRALGTMLGQKIPLKKAIALAEEEASSEYLASKEKYPGVGPAIELLTPSPLSAIGKAKSLGKLGKVGVEALIGGAYGAAEGETLKEQATGALTGGVVGGLGKGIQETGVLGKLSARQLVKKLEPSAKQSKIINRIGEVAAKKLGKSMEYVKEIGEDKIGTVLRDVAEVAPFDSARRVLNKIDDATTAIGAEMVRLSDIATKSGERMPLADVVKRLDAGEIGDLARNAKFQKTRDEASKIMGIFADEIDKHPMVTADDMWEFRKQFDAEFVNPIFEKLKNRIPLTPDERRIIIARQDLDNITNDLIERGLGKAGEDVDKFKKMKEQYNELSEAAKLAYGKTIKDMKADYKALSPDMVSFMAGSLLSTEPAGQIVTGLGAMAAKKAIQEGGRSSIAKGYQATESLLGKPVMGMAAGKVSTEYTKETGETFEGERKPWEKYATQPWEK